MKGKLKVLLITSKFPRYEGDAQPPFVYYLALELVKKGCEVHVLAPHDHLAKKEEIFHEIYVHRFVYFYPKKHQKVAYGPGIPDNLSKSTLAKIQSPLFAISEIISAQKLVRKINPDIVHAHWAFPQGLAAMYSGKPYFVTIYGGEVFMSKKYHLLSVFEKIIKNSAESFSITNGLKKVIREFGIKSKFGVIPLGVDMKKFRPNIKGSDLIRKKFCSKKELMILSVGRLVDKKGHKYLLEAFSKISEKIPNTKLIIVGDGPLYSTLTKMSEDLGLAKKIIFTKEINHSELPKYYSAADLFVLPSVVDKISNMETQGVVFLEAMASKCPIISTNTGGIPDVVTNKKVGILVKQKDSKVLAEKMLLLLKSASLRKSISENAYMHVKKNFTWDMIAKKYIAHYKKAIPKN